MYSAVYISHVHFSNEYVKYVDLSLRNYFIFLLVIPFQQKQKWTMLMKGSFFYAQFMTEHQVELSTVTIKTYLLAVFQSPWPELLHFKRLYPLSEGIMIFIWNLWLAKYSLRLLCPWKVELILLHWFVHVESIICKGQKGKTPGYRYMCKFMILFDHLVKAGKTTTSLDKIQMLLSVTIFQPRGICS